jgi:hypothetical protein
VHDAESPTLASEAPRALELTHEASRSQRRDIAANAKSEVTGMSRGERSAPRVLVTSARTGLAPSPVASAAPSSRQVEIEGKLARVLAHRKNDDTRL